MELNITLAKQELEKREKALKEKVKRCNEITKQADKYLERKPISSILDDVLDDNGCKPIFVNNMQKNSDIEKGIDEDGTAKEKDNKENI